MKILTVSALVCALMALTTADGESDLFKRSASCSDGEIGSNGRCFIYNSLLTTWSQAEKYCQGYPDGHLASVHTTDDYRAIQTLIQKYPKSSVPWLGGTDAEEDGAWLWCDGSYFRPPNWTPGYTDRSRNCLTMGNGGQKKYAEEVCSTPHPFVCAKNP